MSGIAGIAYFDGRPVAPRDIESMARALRAYGPDGWGQLVEGSVGLLHMLMRFTPEDAFEQQPLTGGGGHLRLVAARGWTIGRS